MKSIRRSIPAMAGIALVLSLAGQALAQNATVTLSSQKQYIRGYGGMVHIPWIGDLTAAERTLVFGNDDGQLGFTILRIAVPDGNTSDSSYVATAKAAIAAGGIVYASPWNSSGSMNTADFATYADHLSSFVSYMKDQGAELYAISVQNEPDWGAQGGWRSWTATQCHDFVLQYGAQMGTKLMSCESLNYTKSMYDQILNDPAALANMGVLGTHLYGTPLNAYPYPLFDEKAAGKERWMTEHYTDSTTDANQWPNALGVATELHHAMVDAQFNAYTWWYIKRSYGPINNGAVTKRGWCMAHWSKFVRPGFYRVDATASPSSNVLLSAYTGNSAVVIVIVNNNNSTSSLSITVDGSTISSYAKYTTSSSKSMANDGTVDAANGSMSVSVDGSSVTTLYGTGEVTGSGGAQGEGGAPGNGGSQNGGAPGDGGSQNGGAPGNGGSQNGGAPGNGGSQNGGAPGNGGSQNGGAPGNGGVTSTGGVLITTGGMVSTGGSLISMGGGNIGAGGSSLGGAITSLGGSSLALGGLAGAMNAGNAGTAGTAGTSSQDQTSSDSGCSCHVAGERSNSNPLALLGMLGVLALGTTRRRRSSRG